jgi:hypothetical protein
MTSIYLIHRKIFWRVVNVIFNFEELYFGKDDRKMSKGIIIGAQYL